MNIKKQLENTFETLLFNSRFVVLISVLGSLVASIVMYIHGTYLVVQGVSIFIEQFQLYGINSTNNHEANELVPALISSIDNYLFATVLLIFSMGLYELFISKIDPASRRDDSRPNWLNVKSLDDLKASLGKVILMILIVSFFEKSLDIPYNSSVDLLYLGVGIILISSALFLTHLKIGSEHHEHT